MANMNYVDHLDLFGVPAKEIPCIKFEGPPTESTVGAVGLFGMDTLTGDVWKCTAVDGGKYTWTRLVAEEKFDPTVYGLPVLELTGDTSAMTKDNPVDLQYVYGDRTGTASVKWQGSSSLSYPKKNYTIKFDNAFEASPGWGEQKKYCLKANYIDHSHARNIVSAKLWGEIVKSRTTNDFDMTSCAGLRSVSGDLIHDTAPIEGVITSARSLAVNGACYLDGYTCKKDIVYSIEADVYITSSNELGKVVFGMVNMSDHVSYVAKEVPCNQWIRVNMMTVNPYENGKIMFMLESVQTGENLKFKNVKIQHSLNENEISITSESTFVYEDDGSDASYYCSVNNGILTVNLGEYSRAICIGNKTHAKGTYTIGIGAMTSRAESQVPYEFRIGFVKNGAFSGKILSVEAPYKTAFSVIEVENTMDDAYFTVQPIGGPDCTVPESMQFSFHSICAYRGSLVEGDNYVYTRSPNGGAIDGFPVLIKLNGEFHGLYTFNIPKDGWMFGMGSGDSEAILCADYSEACWFRAEATLNNDFDLEYVSDENNSTWVTESINRLINACMNSDGSDLDTTIAQYLDWESAIDYIIFKALLNGVDMGGKNYILATYDGVKWYCSAYDMDCVYGLDWDGKKFYRVYNSDPMGRGHTVDRLILDYKKDALKTRYAELRAGVMSVDNVVTTFANFIGGIPSVLYEEDARKWPSIPNSATNNIAQIADYYSKRAEFVDAFMEAL